MLEFINTLLTIGTSHSTDREEIKNIRLLNAGCIAWIPLNIIFIIEDLVLNPSPWPNIITFASTAAILLIIMGLQKKNLFTFARALFLGLALLHFMAFAIFLEPGSFLEFFMLLIPIFSTIFFRKIIFSVVSFLISTAAFLWLMNGFNHYPGIELQNIANFALFFAIYLSFVYMKSLNLKSEASLETQRNQALEDKRKIDQQHKELSELHKFQSHFWVNLSHELRTPLTLIKGGVSQLKKGEWNEKQIQRIEDNSEKMRILIDNIMDLAKMRSKKLELNPKVVNLSNSLQKLLSSFEPLFYQKGIEQSLQKPTHHTAFVTVDPLYLERALSNILINAIKYTPVLGKINVSLIAHRNQHVILIEDTGCGIPQNEIPFIFDTFYRANNSINQAGGSGVGLSFTKEVIEMSKGTITVDSVVNVGSSFKIELPATPPPKKSQNEPFQGLRKKTLNNTSILIVEDNIEMRTYLKELLIDFNTIEANNGKEAIKLIEKHTFELILTDYMMPEMNGFEFIHLIRKNNNETPVIVLTARADEKAKLDFLRLGIDDYLNKPFNEEELLIRIQHSLHNNRERISEIQAIKNNKEEQVLFSEEIEPLIQLVKNNLQVNSFGVTELAYQLSMTERTLNRKIKAWTGLTPNGFIREIKLQSARNLIHAKAVFSYKELAREVGFSNSGHFVKLYQERFGSKPEFGLPELSQLDQLN